MRTCIITGANSGIGKSAAAQLAAQGLRVVLACRNLAGAGDVAAQIRKSTGNEQVFARRVDLALMADTRRFADEFTAEFAALDILINNAADFDLSRKEPLMTPEGNEAQFATNLLGPFILTNRLLPLLKQSEDGRIINVASKGLAIYPNLAFDFGDVRAEKAYSPAKTYYQTKLGLLMLSLAQRRQLAGTCISVYAVRVTNVRIDLARYPGLSSAQKTMYKLKSKFAILPDEMAAVYTALATGEKRSGFYYDERLREVHCNKMAYNEAMQEKLVALCERITVAYWLHGFK